MDLNKNFHSLKVSDLWTKDDNFSTECLKRLGLDTVENEKVPNIKKQCLNLKKLLYTMDLVMQNMIGPLSLVMFLNGSINPINFRAGYVRWNVIEITKDSNI